MFLSYVYMERLNHSSVTKQISTFYMIVRKNKSIYKVPAKQNSSKNFFLLFYTSSDRHRAADHEYHVLILSEGFLPVQKSEILENCYFHQKQVFIPEMCKTFYFFLFLSFCKCFFQIQHQKLSIEKLLNGL